MPYVYPEVDDLDGHDLVGAFQCVALVQAFAGAPRTSDWKQGVPVRGKLLLAKGTAIATFEDGVYKSRPGGNGHLSATVPRRLGALHSNRRRLDGGARPPRALSCGLGGLYRGPPAELAELQESDSGNGWESWKLEGAYPEGPWVQCVYGGELTLTRKLSTVTGTCTARHEKTPPTKPKPVSFVCR